jgi:hypothetical protein
MAKRAAKQERGALSNMVREYMAANPKAKPKEIFEALGDKGVKIGLINAVRAKSKAKKRKGRTSTGIKPQVARSNGRDKGNSIVAVIQAAQQLKNLAGGVNQAKAVLEALG